MKTTIEIFADDNRIRIENLGYNYSNNFLNDDEGNRLTPQSIEAFATTKQIEVENMLIERLRASLIKKIHTEYDVAFEEYYTLYPKGEIESFSTKQEEARAWKADNNASTPFIDALTGNDAVKKVELLSAIWSKIEYLAQLESSVVHKRDAIKACETLEELEALEV